MFGRLALVTCYQRLFPSPNSNSITEFRANLAPACYAVSLLFVQFFGRKDKVGCPVKVIGATGNKCTLRSSPELPSELGLSAHPSAAAIFTLLL